MPYPDLGTMYQNGMGASASLMGGQMFTQAQAQDAQKLREMQLANDQTAVMNPLNAQFKQGEIARQGAELPGIRGTAQSLSAKGSEDTQLLSARVAEQLGELKTKVGGQGMVQMGQDAEKLLHAGQIIKGANPDQQKAIFAKAIQQYGGDPNNPMFAKLLAAPDADFENAVNVLGNGMATASSKFIQESKMEEAKTLSAEKIATGHDAATKYAADSRLQAAKERVKGMVATMGVDKTIGTLLKMKADNGGVLPPEYENELQEAKIQQLQARAAGVPAVAPTVLKQDTPLEAARKAGEAGQPKPNAVPHGDIELAKAAQAQWGNSYDPKTYNYRMNNGVVERSKK